MYEISKGYYFFLTKKEVNHQVEINRDFRKGRGGVVLSNFWDLSGA